LDVTELTDIAGVHRTKPVPPMITPAKDRANPSQAPSSHGGLWLHQPRSLHHLLENYQSSRLA